MKSYMYHVKSGDEFKIGQRRVFTFIAPFRMEVQAILADGIVIDDVHYDVRGIERLAVHLGEPMISQGERIGIAVSDLGQNIRNS